MYVRDISHKRPLGMLPAFVTLVSDVKNFHKQYDFCSPTDGRREKASLTRRINNVKRKETSEFDVFILAHCNKYVKCIIYYTYGMKW